MGLRVLEFGVVVAVGLQGCAEKIPRPPTLLPKPVAVDR